MTTNESIAKKLRTSGMMITLGLLAEALSLVWNNPLSFVAFIGVGGLLLAIGVLWYLWTLVSVG